MSARVYNLYTDQNADGSDVTVSVKLATRRPLPRKMLKYHRIFGRIVVGTATKLSGFPV